MYKKINQKIKTLKYDLKKKSFTKTTNHVMMMVNFYAYVHRYVGTTAAVSHIKSLHLNPFRLSTVL